MTHPASLGDWLHEHGDELVAVRRHLHAHPELSWQEHATTQLVAERLELAGLAPKVLSTGTGLLCDIEPADPRAAGLPRVALRADLDALAMDDEKDVHYRSRTPGVAHACGHDVHTVAVLGAGLYLAHHPQVLTRPVRLVFQPAEEKLPGGAVAVIDEGALDGVDSIYGVHCDPKLDVGTVGLKVGEISSAADRIEIRLWGPGGHTARPEQTVDMVRLAASLVTGVPEIVDLQLAAMGHTDDGGRLFAKVVFGAVHAGEASNVIPTHAVLRGSVRTPRSRHGTCCPTWSRPPCAR
jgi:amidohydrolase